MSRRSVKEYILRKRDDYLGAHAQREIAEHEPVRGRHPTSRSGGKDGHDDRQANLQWDIPVTAWKDT